MYIGCNTPQEDTLILLRPPHVVVGIVCQLENVWWQVLLVRSGIAVLCGVFGENLVAIAGDVLVGIEGNDGRGTNRSVDDLFCIAFAQARDDDIVRDWVERREIGRFFEALVKERGLPIGRHQGDETPKRASKRKK